MNGKLSKIKSVVKNIHLKLIITDKIQRIVSEIYRYFTNSLHKDKSYLKNKSMMLSVKSGEQIKIADKHIKLPKHISPKKAVKVDEIVSLYI